ncbi:hypothetical protein [Shouchella clausii]|uniref:hypothetical protein n=1 Tax=Shouchella clausii TaxID=79880 RepID=UPI000BA58E29|nr:hypothetical protein [Shouchella clausii]PAD91666.1 hypothetical protein CHH52_13675 [Shouchella clausii]
MIRGENRRVTRYDVEFVAKTITCNKCGKSADIKEGDYSDLHFKREEFPTIELSFGYGSKWDTERWSFNLCEECLESLVESFAHKPDGYGEDYY